MISTEEAKQLIWTLCSPKAPVSFTISKLSNEVLAAHIRNQTDSPPFHQSAMDGYALRFDDATEYTRLQIRGEVITGKANSQKVTKGTAMRIFTGAALPSGADTVVMQEHTLRDGGELLLTQLPLLKKGANVRLRGSQIKKGAVALEKGHGLNAVSIAYLATLGINKVPVYPKPSVAIIATGNELQLPGKPLGQAQIYESNTFALQALLNEMHFTKPVIHRVKDKEAQIEQVVKKALQSKDVLLITGGISVGDYDLVAPVLKKLGVKTVFHKVAQKPGKPFYFGRKGKTLVFALPGNPASVITCFLEYVKPALQKMMGYNSYELQEVKAISKQAYSKKVGLTHYLKAIVNANGEVDVLSGQESYLLNTFSRANCLVEVPADSEGFSAGEKVSVHLFNTLF